MSMYHIGPTTMPRRSEDDALDCADVRYFSEDPHTNQVEPCPVCGGPRVYCEQCRMWPCEKHATNFGDDGFACDGRCAEITAARQRELEARDYCEPRWAA